MESEGHRVYIWAAGITLLLVLTGSINWVLVKDASPPSHRKPSLLPIKISLATWPLLNSYLVHSLF